MKSHRVVKKFVQPDDGLVVISHSEENISQIASDLAAEFIAEEMTKQLRTAAERDNTPLHAVADNHLKAMTLAVLAALNVGKKALGHPPNADRAALAVKNALLKTLPPVLKATFIDGGEASFGTLTTAAFNPDEPRDDQGQWTDGGGTEPDIDTRPLGLRKPPGIGRVDEPMSHATQNLLRNKRIGNFRRKARERRLKRLKLKGLEDFRTAKGPVALPKLGMRFDDTNPRAAEWAREHAGELAKGISETTRDLIKGAIARAHEGGGLDEEYDEILDAIGDETRASLIARTETMAAANEGNREGWAQAVDAGLLTGDETKTWIATSDACPLCEELDGETTSLDGSYPGDGEDGPPLHPNCRCTEGIVGNG